MRPRGEVIQMLVCKVHDWIIPEECDNVLRCTRCETTYEIASIDNEAWKVIRQDVIDRRTYTFYSDVFDPAFRKARKHADDRSQQC